MGRGKYFPYTKSHRDAERFNAAKRCNSPDRRQHIVERVDKSSEEARDRVPPCTSKSFTETNMQSERRKQIKIGAYDGNTPLETFIAKFSNAADYNEWTDEDCLANMKACLTGGAANVLWDTPKINTILSKSLSRS